MTVLLMDISSNQIYSYSPPGSFDWQKAWNNGVQGVILRAVRTWADGRMPTDSRLLDFAFDAERMIPIIAYYAYIRLAYDPIKQTDNFLALVADLPPARLVIDVELEILDKTLAGKAHNADVLQAALDNVENKAPWAKTPILYSRTTWFDTYIEHRPAWGRYPLWIARYPGLAADGVTPVIDGPWADGNYKPKSWDIYAIWQYAETGPGKRFGAQSEEIDLDWWNGDLASLAEFMVQPLAPADPSTGGVDDDTAHALATLAARQKAMYDDLVRNFPEKSWTNIAEVFK